jgi:hypothetical protein
MLSDFGDREICGLRTAQLVPLTARILLRDSRPTCTARLDIFPLLDQGLFFGGIALLFAFSIPLWSF